jgi:hypothetical protein
MPTRVHLASICFKDNFNPELQEPLVDLTDPTSAMVDVTDFEGAAMPIRISSPTTLTGGSHERMKCQTPTRGHPLSPTRTAHDNKSHGYSARFVLPMQWRRTRIR